MQQSTQQVANHAEGLAQGIRRGLALHPVERCFLDGCVGFTQQAAFTHTWLTDHGRDRAPPGLKLAQHGDHFLQLTLPSNQGRDHTRDTARRLRSFSGADELEGWHCSFKTLQLQGGNGQCLKAVSDQAGRGFTHQRLSGIGIRLQSGC